MFKNTRTIGSFFYEIRGDTSTLMKDLDRAAAEGYKRQKEISGKLMGAGAAMTAAVTFPVVMAARATRDSAAEMMDSLGAVEHTYGQAAQTIIDWVDQVKQAEGHYYGLSRGLAFSTAARLFPLTARFQEGEEQAKTAIELMKLAADMSAYMGGSVEEAMGAIESAIAGQSFVPLRKYGIALSEAALASIAAREGIINLDLRMQEALFKQEEAQIRLEKAMKKHGQGSREAEKAAIDLAKAEEEVARVTDGKGVVLTDAQRAEAAYIAIMEQSAFLQGQYSREVDPLSGVMKENAAAAERLKEAVGEAAAPAMIAFYEAQIKVWDSISGLPDEVMKLGAAMAGIGAATGPIMGVAGAILELVTNWRMLRALQGLGGAAAVGGAAAAGSIGKTGGILAGAGGLLRGGAKLVGRIAAPVSLVLLANEAGRLLPGSEGRSLIEGAISGITGYDPFDEVDTSTAGMFLDTVEHLKRMGHSEQEASRRAAEVYNININQTFSHQVTPEEGARYAEHAVRGTQRGRR